MIGCTGAMSSGIVVSSQVQQQAGEQQQDDDRDAARRATTLLAERLPAMDDSMREVDRIESPVSQLEHGADVEAQGWGGSTMLTRQERTKLAIDVDAMRAKVALAKGAQWLVVL